MKLALPILRQKTKNIAIAIFITTTLASTTTSANAQQQAYTSTAVNLRAGPSKDFPIVQRLPYGAGVLVTGCTENYRWCDVSVGNSHGWIYAGNIVYAYQGKQVPVLSYGTVIGIGITPFIFNNYWDNYYTGFSWYPQRQYWRNLPYATRSPVVRPAAPVRRPPAAVVRPVVPRVAAPRAATPRPAPTQARPVTRTPAPREAQSRAPQRNNASPQTNQRNAQTSPVR